LRTEEAEYEERIKEWGKNDSLYGLPKPPIWLRLVIELLDLGVEPERKRDGLMIDGGIILAVNSNKYRYDGRGVWYRRGKLDKFIEEVKAGKRK
jgi:hypothetical protein